MEADFVGLFTSDSARSTNHYVKHNIVESIIVFAMLIIQQQGAKHVCNDFQTIAWFFFSLASIQALIVWNNRHRRSTNIYKVIQYSISANDIHRILLHSLQLLIGCYLRLDALNHFGIFFAFLLENSESLFLQPIKDAYHFSFYNEKVRGNRRTTWMFLLFGFLLVAGVNAYEYGSLAHAVMLLVLTLAVKKWQPYIVETKNRMVTCSHSHLASVCGAWIMAISLSAFVPPRTKRIGIDSVETDNTSWYWCVCGFFTAGINVYLTYGNHSSLTRASTSDRWYALMTSTVTGLIGSLLVSCCQGDWLQFVADFLASSVIIYAQWAEATSTGITSTQTQASEYDLEMFRSAHGTRNYADPLHVLTVLWNRDESRKILLFLAVNMAFMMVELLVGIWSNSLGLIGDAGHMFFDNGALLIGLIASYIGQLPPDAQYTYGYGRVEVLSGFFNSVLLIIMVCHLLVEALERVTDPPQVKTDNLLLTSVLGLLVNIVGLIWFHDLAHGHSHGSSSTGGHGHSHGHSCGSHQSHGEVEHGHHHCIKHESTCSGNSNMYGVYLHVLADTLGSVGVIISTLLIQWKEWHVADPISSVAIAIMILASTVPLLKDTLLQLLQRVPQEFVPLITEALREVEKLRVHVIKWHLWRHAGDVNVASVHILVDDNVVEQDVLASVRKIFKDRIGIDANDLTVQIEKRRCIGEGVGQLEPQKKALLDHHKHCHSHVHGHTHPPNDYIHDHVSEMSTYENPAQFHPRETLFQCSTSLHSMNHHNMHQPTKPYHVYPSYSA